MKKLQPIVLCFLSFLLLLSPVVVEAQSYSETKNQNLSAAQLKWEYRRLWIDHIMWSRNYIITLFQNSPDLKQATQRIIRNVQEIGNSISPYYGKAASNQFTKLLAVHLNIAVKLLDSLKKGESTNIQKYETEWHKNADEIIRFLGNLNPAWKRKELKGEFYMHLKMMSDIAYARKEKKWEEEIRLMDKSMDHIIHLADIFSQGIIQQFPERFNNA